MLQSKYYRHYANWDCSVDITCFAFNCALRQPSLINLLAHCVDTLVSLCVFKQFTSTVQVCDYVNVLFPA